MPQFIGNLRVLRVATISSLLVFFVVLCSTPARGSEREGYSGLFVTEVYYDTPGIDADEEWIELVNTTNSEIDLSKFKIGDEESRGGGEGMMRFPDGSSLGSGKTIVIAQSSTGFESLFTRQSDYEIRDSTPSVPDLLPYRTWASGDIRLANDGDEILILDEVNAAVDVVAYGDSMFSVLGVFTGPSVAGVHTGQSIERVPADCDTDTASDWQPNRAPSPWDSSYDGECFPGERPDLRSLMPIGTIQGQTGVSGYTNQLVSFRAIVTGVLEDQNAQGVIYYSFFAQDLPGIDDNNPLTSDGLAIFTGRIKPEVVPGDVVAITGNVTEFFGLTEIDDDDLSIIVESRGNELPQPIRIDPPPDKESSQDYFERYESMLVELPPTIVIGPTHDGCGFEVIRRDSGVNHIHHEFDADLAGYVVNVLHPSDVNCSDIPSVNAGDVIQSLMGPLTYHFDKFKIVYQDPSDLKIEPIDPNIKWQVPSQSLDQFSVTSFNLNDYFDEPSLATESDAATETSAGLTIRREKITYVVGQLLQCPTIVGIQEVENQRLLLDLAATLEKPCGFFYQVSHLDSPDVRGSDVALMTDSRRVSVADIALNQVCTPLLTDVEDPNAGCSDNTYPLYSRPPLSALLNVDGERLFVIVNHFKSKRGGAAKTALLRQYQATHLARLAHSIAENDSPTPTIVIGDFNDYAGSPSMEILTKEADLVDILRLVPETHRYTYIFDGERQLIDWILVSPVLERRVADANILHVNADYSNAMRFDLTPEGLPFRSSDHDIPVVVLASASSDGESTPGQASSYEQEGSTSRSLNLGEIELPEELKIAYRSVFRVSLIVVSAGLEVLTFLIGKRT